MVVGLRSASIAFLALVLFIGCGDGVRKQDLSADEYFDYAKSKFDEEDFLDAITEFTIVTLKFSGNPVVDDAQYYLAESHFKQKEYLVAASEFQKLIHDYPQSPYLELAQFKIGMSFYKMSLRPELDQEYTRKAIRQFQDFVEEYSEHELRENAEKYIAEMRFKLAEKKMIGADTYRKMGVHDAAVIYYDIILNEFYDTELADEALFYKGTSLLKLKKFGEAQTSLTVFLEKYPEHDLASRAKDRLAKATNGLNDQQANIESTNGDK